jgi:hypothetical protein
MREADSLMPAAPSAPAAPGPSAPPARASFRQRVEGHPIGILIGVAVAAITATLAIVAPIAQLSLDSRVAALDQRLAEQQANHAAAVTALEKQMAEDHIKQTAEIEALKAQVEDVRREAAQQLADEQARSQARIEELDRSLSSIKRSLGSDTEYYDVGALIVTPEGASSLPETSKYFPDDGFYALDVDLASGWTYEVTTELGMTAELLGVTEDVLRERGDPAQVDAMTRFPVHLWRLGEDRSLTYYDAVAGQRFELHPRTEVSLQRVSHDDYLALVEASVQSDEAKAAIRAGFARDPAGWVLQDQLALEISSSGGLRARIDSLQKRDTIAYARVETTLPQVRFKGSDEELREYYWSREWLLIATDDDLYLVKLFVADDDHRSPDYGSVGAWLDAFRVLDS